MVILYIYFLFGIIFSNVFCTTTDDFNLTKCEIQENVFYSILCYLNTTNNYPNDTQNYIKKNKEQILANIIDYFSSHNLTFLNEVIENFFDIDSNTLIDQAFNIIRKNNSGLYVLDYVSDIILYISNFSNIDYNSVFHLLQYVLNYEGVDEFIKNIPIKNDTILKLAETYINKTDFFPIYENFRGLIWNRSDLILNLIYDILYSYNNSTKVSKLIVDFKDGNYSHDTFFDFFEIFKKHNATILEKISKNINFNDKVADIIKNNMIKPSIFNELYILLYQEQVIYVLFDMLKNHNNQTYLITNLPELSKSFLNAAVSIYPNSVTFLMPVIRNITSEIMAKSFEHEDFINIINVDLMNNIKDYFMKDETFKNRVSNDCLSFFENIFFENRHDATFYYIKKIMIMSTKDKNDFLSYENCLAGQKNFSELEELNYIVKPIFVISILDDLLNKNKFKNSILNEKYNYLMSFCLPYGIYKNDTKEICSEGDYNIIMQKLMGLYTNINSAKIDVISINDNKFEIDDYISCILSIIIILIPFFIWLFLCTYKRIKIWKYRKDNKINKLIDDGQNLEISNTNKKKLIKNNNQEKANQFKPKNWYKYLNAYFNIIRNGSELFNFSLNETNFNNLNGITYIKGILGISMILYILGQVYLILFNMPTKAISQTSFYNMIKNPFYGFIYISLRYSPRILLSCSGYILAYKFLHFIEQNQNHYFWKFLFVQSYKYILLVFIVLFMRYSFYSIDNILNDQKRPAMEIYKYNLEQNLVPFFEKLFSFLLTKPSDNEFIKRQNLVQYFYLPLNEAFLFLFGIFLISIGFWLKLRIDFIILFLIFGLYIGKILYYTLDLKIKEYYTTLYFYLYDYGELMLNPIFNLPYYLVGMYFGFINFSIQKGVSIHKKEHKESYAIIEILEDDEEINDINLKKDDNNLEKIELIGITDENENESRKTYRPDNSETSDKVVINTNYSYQHKRKSKRKTNKKKDKNTQKEVKRPMTYNNFELDDKVKEMPFLIIPIKFLTCNRKFNNACYLGVIIIFCLIFMIFNITLQQIILFDLFDIKGENKVDIATTLEDFISDKSLNIFYLIDIELVVFMINWIFFILYSRSEKSADIFDFFNTKYWSFFVKSYFSFILVSSPIILYTFYESETVISLDLGNIYLYYFLNLIFILLGDIIFYSCFEFPFKKIFKSFFISEEIINMENYEENVDNLDENKIDVKEEELLKI